MFFFIYNNNNNDNDDKMKIWFKKKWNLRRSEHPRVSTIRFVGLSLWCRIVARHVALIASYLDLALDLSWYGNVVIYLFNTYLVRGKIWIEYMQRWETGTCAF